MWEGLSRLLLAPAVGTTAPHPFPYQGSKRRIAKFILPYFPVGLDRLVEPFCGSAAVSISAAVTGRARRFWLNDLDGPLMALWKEIVERPEPLVASYAKLWRDQQSDKKTFFFNVRRDFNTFRRPEHLLYLLARIVKGSVRYSADGVFNQSADNRRAGMRPSALRRQILGVHQLLAGRTTLSAKDFRQVALECKSQDLVYMDPPYQGTSQTHDRRYRRGVGYEELVDVLHTMNEMGMSYIVSYDGRTGGKTHGRLLPRSLELRHFYVNAGRSTQATLLGDERETVESLYLSPALLRRLDSPVQRRESTALVHSKSCCAGKVS